MGNLGAGSSPGSLQGLHDQADESVKDTFANARGLREYLNSIDRLEPEELEEIVGQAIKLLEGFYVHLPLKRAMHAADPLQRLRLLRRRLAHLPSEIAFHHEMTGIFTSLRDLHTNYVLPNYFSDKVAFLPFRVEQYYAAGSRRYIVTELARGFGAGSFGRGVTLTYWNGIPIDRAVEIAASYHAGSNAAARHARGVEGLTKRALSISPPPDEEWVTVGYLDAEGDPQEARIDWLVATLPQEADAFASGDPAGAAAALGLDLEGDTFRRINKLLFAQHVIAASKQMESARLSLEEEVAAAAFRGEAPSEIEARKKRAPPPALGTQSTMPEVFAAKVVEVDGRRYGYVRIFTFSVPRDGPFVDEFLRLIELPGMEDGLIVDVRGNGGGLIWAGERLLQLLTPKTIEPCRVQFISTAANSQLCRTHAILQPWQRSLDRAVETGAAFSAGFPITPPERCNDIGQRYYGPVVLVTDARCYSTTDIFAAGFQDHRIGTILGMDSNTGAGGANVWTLGQIHGFFQGAGASSPVTPLPRGADMRVAIRRTLRVGPEAGTELEDLGVEPDIVHQRTHRDVLNDNLDMIDAAVRLLKKGGARKFVVTPGGPGKLTLSTQGVDYIEVTVGGRAHSSHNMDHGPITLDLGPGSHAIELRGYAKGQLACCRRLP